jgi:hypothetical protein
MLDGRKLQTPARHALVLPTRALALAVAAEWQWQVGPSLLDPSTTLACEPSHGSALIGAGCQENPSFYNAPHVLGSHSP